MNVLSLFDGSSCGQVALERAGIKVNKYFASEIDKHAITITQKNYPNTIQLGDIRSIKALDLPAIDLVFGGSPCQGFSMAGKRLNFDDPRSALFFEFVRLITEVKPKYFLLENVKMKKECQDVISEYLGVKPILINSNLVSAQNRQRLYWTNIPNISQPADKGILLKDIIEKDVEEKYFLSEKRIKLMETVRFGQTNKICDLDGKSMCLSASMGMGGGYEPKIKVEKNGQWQIRKLTPLECERLQTLPDGYTAGVSNSQRYKMLGNGWTVDVIAHLFSGLRY